jgi:tripartite-type tricarboxylate transporter receptor subunit TctC
VKDFIAAAKAQPGKINIGSAGSGSGTHFSGQLFQQHAGIKLVHVPYKSAGLSSTDTASGQIQSSMSTPPAAMPLVKAGRLKILVSFGPKRSDLLPGIPTLAESGVPGVVVTNWYSIMSVGGTPQPVIARLYKELERAVASSDMRQRLAAAALEPVANTTEEFKKRIADELQRWKKVMHDAGIKPE